MIPEGNEGASESGGYRSYAGRINFNNIDYRQFEYGLEAGLGFIG